MKLGDKITYAAVLRRTWVGPKDIATWLPWAVAPTHGVIVGTRTLSIGRTDVESDMDEWSGRSYSVRTWRRLGSVRAVLVAYDLVRAPIYVPLDAVYYCPPEIVERIMRPRLTAISSAEEPEDDSAPSYLYQPDDPTACHSCGYLGCEGNCPTEET